MMAKSEGLSARQRRRIRADIARRLVQSDIKHMQESCALTTADSVSASELSEDSPIQATSITGTLDSFAGEQEPESPEMQVDIGGESASEPSDDADDSNSLLCSSSSDDSMSEDGDLDVSPDFSSDSELCSSGDEEVEREGLCTSKCNPLFDGAQLCADEFSVALMSISHKHGLTYSAISDILQLFHCVLPSPTTLPPSLHVLLKDFVGYDASTVIHRCCGNCSRLLSPGNCCRSECLACNAGEATFIEVKIDSLIKERFMDGKFLELLQYRFKRQTCASYMSDMYDGGVYQERFSFFSSLYNVSFTLNYDGAPKFKSSNMQIWPIQLSINELPPTVRRNKDYMLLVGLWCATSKPPAFSFLEPIFKRLKLMEEEGVEVDIPNEGKRTVRGQLLCAIMDLPAKAAILNCTQYNGYYGCSGCKHPGRVVKVGRGHARSYDYRPSVQMRNHTDHLLDAQDALDNGKVMFGVKGFSPLHMIPSFDVIKCCPVDYMHCILLGVVKSILAKLWFNSSFHKEEWYIGKRIGDIDRRLLEIRMPDHVSRGPRSLCHRKFWKASEWKNFLFFYVPTTLYGILPDKHYIHAMILVKAIRIILGTTVSEDGIKMAEKLIKKFCKLMEEYYGLRSCGINVHMLLHLPYFVRCYGPLWTHSAFPFEGQMGHFLRHSHATHGISRQIVSASLLSSKLRSKRQLLTESPLCSFQMKSFFGNFQSLESSTSGIQMVGKPKMCTLNDDEVHQVNQLLICNGLPVLGNSTTFIYHKAIINGKTFFSINNKRVKKRNSYTVMFRDSESSSNQCFAIVEKFITSNGHHMAAVKTLRTHVSGPPHDIADSVVTADSLQALFNDYITYEEGFSKFIFATSIIQKCFNLSNNNWKVLTLPINDVENE